jgi:hypothetical protein
MSEWRLSCKDCACHDCSQRENCASCGCDGICTEDMEYFVEDCDDYEVGWD